MYSVAQTTCAWLLTVISAILFGLRLWIHLRLPAKSKSPLIVASDGVLFLCFLLALTTNISTEMEQAAVLKQPDFHTTKDSLIVGFPFLIFLSTN